MFDEKPEKVKPGIKNANFYGGKRTNGVSHRKNAVAKRIRGIKNREARAMLYAERGRMGPLDWHARLTAISLGTI